MRARDGRTCVSGIQTADFGMAFGRCGPLMVGELRINRFVFRFGSPRPVEQPSRSPSPAATVAQLLLWSVVVGVILSALGITPFNIVDQFGLIFRRIYDLGFGAFHWAAQYILLGAIIVVPVWLISRLLGGRGGR